MYSSNSTYDEKASSKPPVSSAPTSYGQSTIGVPLSFNQHPGAYQTQTATEGPWSTSLCGCFEDVPNCCITCWCPCVTFGQIAEIVDQGSTSCALSGGIYSVIGLVTGCACMYSCIYRTKMRRQFMLQESPCPDCLLHCCCEHLALCQEYRELQHRGFDVSKGWQGNMERQNYGIRMAPVVDEGMSR